MVLLGSLIKSDHNETEMKESRRREGAAMVDVGDLTISRGKRQCGKRMCTSSLGLLFVSYRCLYTVGNPKE